MWTNSRSSEGDSRPANLRAPASSGLGLRSQAFDPASLDRSIFGASRPRGARLTPTSWGWLILAFPLAGTVVVSLGWRIWPGKVPGYIGSLAILGSFVCSVGSFLTLHDRAPEARSVTSTLYDYTHTVGVNVGMSILIDPLSVFMALVVSGVSLLIHVYSVAYMGSDRGYTRFFAYMNYFVFSMLLLVLAANIVLLIVGWAFVGAASYLLISF